MHKKLIKNELKIIFDKLLLLLKNAGSRLNDCVFLSVDDCVILVVKNCDQEESDFLRKVFLETKKKKLDKNKKSL